MPAEEFKYFFCYAHEDLKFVLRLAKELRELGANVWLDELDIVGGQHWDRAVEEALKSCKGMIAVLSPEAVASENVMDEVSYALDEGKLVVPILIRSCDIPFRLRRVQYIDFTADYDTGFSRLLRALSIEQPIRPPKSAATQEPAVQEPSLLKQSESTIGEQEPAKAGGKRQMAKVIAAIFVVVLIVVVLMAILKPKTYSLTTTAIDGSVSKSPDQTSYNVGETVTLEAVPNEEYGFTNWSGDLSGSTNPAKLVMDADKMVTANFEPLKDRETKASTIVTNSVGMKLVYIPADSFMMGSGDSAAQLAKEYDVNEAFIPQHQVRISKGFWMGQTEVTQGQYESVMDARPWSRKVNVQEGANNPAVYVSWDDAVEFCRKLSQQEGETYRLPTEAEWEYACRAGTTTRFSFGDNDSSLGDYAWFDGNADMVGQQYAHSVGQKEPNLWDLYDMHGNVEEWCSDYYDVHYYSNSPSVDPKGPPSGTDRCLRGGSWDLSERYQRCSSRNMCAPDICYSFIGFRVVRSQS